MDRYSRAEGSETPDFDVAKASATLRSRQQQLQAHLETLQGQGLRGFSTRRVRLLFSGVPRKELPSLSRRRIGKLTQSAQLPQAEVEILRSKATICVVYSEQVAPKRLSVTAHPRELVDNLGHITPTFEALASAMTQLTAEQHRFLAFLLARAVGQDLSIEREGQDRVSIALSAAQAAFCLN